MKKKCMSCGNLYKTDEKLSKICPKCVKDKVTQMERARKTKKNKSSIEYMGYNEVTLGYHGTVGGYD